MVSVHELNSGERDGFLTSHHLKNAVRQAEQRRLDEILVIDVDAHHYETDSFKDIIKYIEDPVVRHRAEYGARPAYRSSVDPRNNQSNAGRVFRYGAKSTEATPEGIPRDVEVIRRTMKAVGIDYQIVFPTPMLTLGLHPDKQIEVEMSWAYTRWFTEEILPHEPSIKTMVYLPMNSPEACLRAIEKFSDHPSVVGFMAAAARRSMPIHDNALVPVYQALQERGKPLGFHAIFDPEERMFDGMNRFLSVHSLGFVFFNMVHMTNWIFNGMPERFPNLNLIWIESGLSWVPFMMQRLDHEYLMRSSEAPLLKRKPSEYMRDFFYSTQPMELNNLEATELTFKMINAETQLCFASDYPHWDFDLPSTVTDLPFLSTEAKHNILGRNAARLFGIDDPRAAVGHDTLAAVPREN